MNFAKEVGKIIFNRQILLLYGSTLASVVLSLFVSVLNCRLLSPEEYGNYKYVYNILYLVSGWLLFGYFSSGCRLIANTKNPYKIRQLKGAMVLILCAAFVILAICMLGLAFLNQQKAQHEIALLLFCSVPVCSAPLLHNYINVVARGDNHIVRLALSRILPPLAYIVTAYILLGHIIAASTMNVFLLYFGTSCIVLVILLATDPMSFCQLKATFRELQRENRQYGIHVYWGSVLGITMGYFSGILLGIWGSNKAAVGFYTLGWAIASPLMMLPSIIGTVHFRAFAEAKRISSNIFWGTLGLSVGSFLIFAFVAGPLAEVLYPSGYQSVGLISIFLGVATTIHGFGDMVNCFLGAHGQGRAWRNSALGAGMILIIGNVVTIYFWGITGAIITRILASWFYAGALLYYYIKYVSSANLNRVQ